MVLHVLQQRHAAIEEFHRHLTKAVGTVEGEVGKDQHRLLELLSYLAALVYHFRSRRPLWSPSARPTILPRWTTGSVDLWTLSPDVIWLTLAQGFANHVNNHAEELRHRLVPHEGKKPIKVRRDDFLQGSPENPWPDVWSEFSSAIKKAIGRENHSLVLSDFSTTGPTERAASVVSRTASYRRLHLRFH